MGEGMRGRVAAVLACVGAALACAAAGEGTALRGFTETRGGSGGRVIRVTNLNAQGPGSLRAALEEKGPRIVVFEVGGVIDLNKRNLNVTAPFVTVAGQTAPAPGVTLIRGGVSVQTHDVVVRHIRVRPGDAGQAKRSGWEPDGLSTSGEQARDILINHCSFSWATDENLSASGARLAGPEKTSRRVTFSNCIIAEGLSRSTHAKGEHSKGSLIHDFCREIAVVGNLYAHNVQRNPYFKAHTTGVIVNNLIYDPGSAAIQLNFSPAEWEGAAVKPENCRVSIVGNVLRYGASTRKGLALAASRGDAFMADNLAFQTDGSPAPLVSGAVRLLDERPVWPEGLRPLPAAEVEAYIVRHAGARPRERDATDRRIIENLTARKGRVIDSQDEVGGYPVAEMTQRQLEVPEGAAAVDGWLERLAEEVE